jgi:hypothetical protein
MTRHEMLCEALRQLGRASGIDPLEGACCIAVFQSELS